MKTLLVVEDSKDYRELLTKRLTKEGYKVLEAENGKVALSLAKKEPIDLILLDLLMPEVDGVSFYYQLTHVAKKHFPIIILTNMTSAVGYNENVKEVLIKAETPLDQVVEKVKQYA